MEDISGNILNTILAEIDNSLSFETSIVLCGGAASILTHDKSYRTGDIDLVFSNPKLEFSSEQFQKIQEKFNLKEGWINDSAKGFTNCLHPDFQNRITVCCKLSKMTVYALSTPDIITMKLARGEPKDISYINSVTLRDSEKEIVRTNLEYMAKTRPDSAHKAKLRAQELGIFESEKISPDTIETISEMLQYLGQEGIKADPSVLSDIRKKIEEGIPLPELARRYTQLDKNNPTGPEL